MANHEELKREHELALACEFANYLCDAGHELGTVRTGDARKREPDAVCDSPSGPVGIEVADGYYDKDTAKGLWGLAEGKGLPPRSGFINPDLELTRALSTTLLKHCRNKYSTSTTWLVLNVAHQALTVPEDAPRLFRYFQVPVDCTFRGVYLRLKQNYSDKCVFVKVPDQETQT